jgi:NDP-hexose-3-ketoreductase
MLADPEVDAVYLSTPIGLHEQQGLSVLEAGRHLWCEKSLTDSLGATERLADAARERDLVLAEAFMYLHHPQLLALQRWIESGAIGRVRSIQGRFGFPHLDPGDSRYRPDLGGGALLDIGVYPASAALFLTGEEPETVLAQLGRDDGYEVDTNGSALLRFASDVHAFLDWGFGRAYRSELEVWGEAGTIFVERAYSKPAAFVASLSLRRQDGGIEEKTAGSANHFVLMFSSFARAIENAALREGYQQQALRQARVVAAIREAAR